MPTTAYTHAAPCAYMYCTRPHAHTARPFAPPLHRLPTCSMRSCCLPLLRSAPARPISSVNAFASRARASLLSRSPNANAASFSLLSRSLFSRSCVCVFALLLAYLLKLLRRRRRAPDATSQSAIYGVKRVSERKNNANGEADGAEDGPTAGEDTHRMRVCDCGESRD